MDLHFDLILKSDEWTTHLPIYTEDIVENLGDSEILTLKEFGQIILEFYSENDEDKLVVEELDDFEILGREENNDESYFLPNKGPLSLFNYDDSFPLQRVPLIPGYYTLKIKSETVSYFTYFKIVPKDLSLTEWEMMRQNIEEISDGLATDFIKRRKSDYQYASISEQNVSNMNDKLEKFIEESTKIANSIQGIRKESKYRISKRYSWLPVGRESFVDNETFRKLSERPEKKGNLYVPNRYIEYDVPENRWIKYILVYFLKFCKTGIDHYSRIKDAIIEDYNQNSKFIKNYPLDTRLFSENAFESKKSQIQINLKKLKELCTLFEQTLNDEFMLNLPYKRPELVPKALILSPKYNIVYKAYLEIKQNNGKLKFDSRYKYYWKRTDLLYEIWCYVVTIQSFLSNQYSPVNGWIFDLDSKNNQIPFLKDGTRVRLSSQSGYINIVFNEALKSNPKSLNSDSPIITASRRNKPDIRIDIFDVTMQYAGSVLIDAKYKKLNNIIHAHDDKKTMNQLREYRNDPYSNLVDIPGDLAKQFKVVQAVFALYPVDDKTKVGEKFNYQGIYFLEITPKKGIKYFADQILSAVNARLQLQSKYFNKR
ncbi:hypothetical protein L963_1510 [Leuconostoc mesenteroides subsp. cremoris T26]|nr:hypothetical protein L963_1510 [Leuconostoc mesenteroides subsp. cremoris T26]